MRGIEVLLFHGIHLLDGDCSQLLLHTVNVSGQGLLGRLVSCLLCRIFLGLRLRLLWLFHLLQLLPLLLHLGDRARHLQLGVGGGFVQGKLLLLLLLLGPPRFELRELLCCRLGFVGAHPCHVLRDGLLHVLDGSNLLLNHLGQVRPSLHLQSSLLHWAKTILQVFELALEVRLRSTCLVHPLLVLSAKLRDLLPLLLRGHLDDVVSLQLIAASVDVRFQLISQARQGRRLLLLLFQLQKALLELFDLLRGQRLRLVVCPLEGQRLLMLLLLLLQNHLRLLRGVFGAIGFRCRSLRRGLLS
mmetsp:Transcript_20433/g.38428  ORF Transcript_20433/g.38428 Transcript_20433/m.38428 type:complete len:301 (+) Transcript_20433:112-1014(+)